MLKWLMATRPRVGFPVTGIVHMFLATIGFAGLQAALADTSWGGVVFFALVATFGIIGLTALALELLLRRRRPRTYAGRTPDGVGATVVPRPGWTIAIGSAAIVAPAIAALVGAGFALREQSWLLGSVLSLAGLWAGSYLVPVALGQVTSGGVYLTPDGIEHRRYGTWWRVGWHDILDVVPREPLALILRDGAVPTRGRIGWGWKGDVGAPDGVLGIQARFLTLDHHMLSTVIVFLLGRPDRRDELGTEGSLQAEIVDNFSSDRGTQP